MKLAFRVSVMLIAAVTMVPGVHAQEEHEPNVEPFRGLGAWVDIFDDAQYRGPESTVQALAGHGVRTLYLETASYRFPGPIRFPELAGRFLDAAHAAGMRVVAWYVPDFVDLRRDLGWSLAAVNFTSVAGERFDAFALDIEVTAVADPNERAARLLELSGAIREAVGPGYPLGAITPSPLRSPSYWPVFPDAELAGIYDAYLPMAYWSHHSFGETAAHDYISRSADVVRLATGRPDIPIHVIGGLAEGADAAEMRGFARAVETQKLIGASVYDAASSGPEDWAALASLRFPEPEPTARKPKPRRLQLGQDLGTYGSLPGADRTFEDEVAFMAGPLGGTWEVDYEVYDLGGGEASVSVNGERVAGLAPTGEDTWGDRSTAILPDDLLDDRGPNTVTFSVEPEAAGLWGVRRVTLIAPPVDLEDRGPHGAIPQSDPGRGDRVTYEFRADGHPMIVSARGFDVDGDEVRVILNGRTIEGLASTPPATWGRGQAIILREPFLRAGVNRLTFDGLGDPSNAWGVRLDRVSAVALF